MGSSIRNKIAGGAAFALPCSAVAHAQAQSYGESANLTTMLVAYAAIVIMAVLIYLIPTFVAFSRKHPNRWIIAVINVAFGGTVIGWFGALVWAMSAAHLSPTGSNGGESGINIFANDPVTVRVARRPGRAEKVDAPAAAATAAGPRDKSEPTAWFGSDQSVPAPLRDASPLRSSDQPAVQAFTTPRGDGNTMLEQLERLAALRNSGSLTDDEFAAMKANVLDQSKLS